MEAMFRITAAEFDLSLFRKIEEWIKTNQQSEIIISIKGENAANDTTYFNSLVSSVKEMEEGKTTTFSMEELELYLTDKFS